MSLSNIEVRHHSLTPNDYTREHSNAFYASCDAHDSSTGLSTSTRQHHTNEVRIDNAQAPTTDVAISGAAVKDPKEIITAIEQERHSLVDEPQHRHSALIPQAPTQSCFNTLIPDASDVMIKSEQRQLDIAQHPQEDILMMLSALLLRITATNDTLHSSGSSSAPKPGSPLLAFHARNIPSISIKAYLTRILKYCPMSSDIFLSLLIYFDRMSHIASNAALLRSSEAFTSTRQIMGADTYALAIDSYNVHRLVITGIVVASKFCSDVFYTNSRYAKVGGLPLSELNHLEFQFLLLNDFRLMIPVDVLQRYGDQLLRFWHTELES